MATRSTLEELFKRVWPTLSEKERRLFAASEAQKWGYGGISLVSDICKLSRTTISKGLKELKEPQVDDGRIRRKGAGRPNLLSFDQELPKLLNSILEKGDELSDGVPVPLSWTLKSTRQLAKELSEAKHPVSYVKVGQILKELGYSLKSKKKVKKNKSHEERALQYELLNTETSLNLEASQPVLYLTRSYAKRAPEGLEGYLPLEMEGSLADLLTGLIERWWDEYRVKGMKELNSLLVIVNDSVNATVSEDEKLSLELPVLQEKLKLNSRFLDFPVGTHRWNLESSEIISLALEQKESLRPEDLLSKVYLLSWEKPEGLGEPLRYHVKF
ncbi:MAG: hypothetical protein LBE27_00560 [Deltaproteobacteria bacterium]|nr:hypothetical protein [Deltaproteobacteria bacterium]